MKNAHASLDIAHALSLPLCSLLTVVDEINFLPAVLARDVSVDNKRAPQKKVHETAAKAFYN